MEVNKQCFALLQVRTVDTNWHDTKKVLRKDHRWSLADLLDRDEKEKLFNEHIENLTKRNRDMFHKLLNETSEVALTSTWREVKKLIKDDPRYSKFSSSDRVSSWFFLLVQGANSAMHCLKTCWVISQTTL